MTAALINRFPQLAAMDMPSCTFLRQRLSPMRRPAGSVLFRPGELCPSFTFLIAGSVAVRRVTRSGREMLLYRVVPGQTCIMSTACLINAERYAAEGVAESAVEALALAPVDFDRLMAGAEGFRRFVMGSFAMRIGDLMQRIEELADTPVGCRLAERLLALRDSDGHVAATHHALAADIGTAREVVTRALGDFADRHWVRMGRGEIVVLDAPALLGLAAKGA